MWKWRSLLSALSSSFPEPGREAVRWDQCPSIVPVGPWQTSSAPGSPGILPRRGLPHECGCSMAASALMWDVVYSCSPPRPARQTVVQEANDVVCRRIVPRRCEDPPLMPSTRRPDASCAARPKPIAHLRAVAVSPCCCVEDAPQPRATDRPRVGRMPGEEQSRLVNRQDLAVASRFDTSRGVPPGPCYQHVIFAVR